MIIEVNRPTKVNIEYVSIEIPLRYGDEDVPYDFPLRNKDKWNVSIEIDSGKIHGWPEGKAGKFFTKVCDTGSYWLVSNTGDIVAEIESDYCPNLLIPGEYGDYIDLDIDKNGTIKNWPKTPDVSEFFEQ